MVIVVQVGRGRGGRLSRLRRTVLNVERKKGDRKAGRNMKISVTRQPNEGRSVNILSVAFDVLHHHQNAL